MLRSGNLPRDELLWWASMLPPEGKGGAGGALGVKRDT